MHPRRLCSALLAAGSLLLTLGLPAIARFAGEANVFAWRVTAPGADHPDYLVGTIHLSLEEGEHLPAALTDAVASASAFVMEADSDDVTPEVVRRHILEPGGNHLDRILPQASYQKLLRAAAAVGLDTRTVLSVKPWFLTAALSLPRTPPRKVLDNLLRERAQAAEVPVTYLETADEQLDVLNQLDERENLEMLVETLANLQQETTELQALTRAYRSDDLAAIRKLMLDDPKTKRFPTYFRRLFDDRNARWRPEIERTFDQEDAVVAVGLGHLIGEHGLLRALEKDGYRVERLAL